jgi:tetratricopeptide (TPR) repeat protein
MRAFPVVLALASLLLATSPATPQARTIARPPLLRAAAAEQPIRLETAKVEVEAAGGFARTTLLLTLRNPNARVLEGTLQFPLQPGQQVAGFALDIDGALRDAVPVPQEHGRQVFEAIERRGVDPGLLEQVAGNQFRLRVYPIPAHGTRQVRLVLEEAMRRDGDAWRYALPLDALADVGNFDLRVSARGMRRAPITEGAFGPLDFERSRDGFKASIARSNFRPRHGLGLRFPASTEPQAFAAAFDGDHFVLAEVPVAARSAARVIPRSIGLLWDASASARHRDRPGELALLDGYFRAMGDGEVRLRVLRDVGADGGRFTVRGGDWSALRKALEALPEDGASDLADWTPDAAVGEYLLVSDGLRTWGDRPVPGLLPGQRLFAIASGAGVDAARLSALAQARGGRLVAWQDSTGLGVARRTLLEQGMSIVALRGEGVADLQVQSRFAEGGLLRFAGRLTAPSGVIHVTLDDAGQRRELRVAVAADAAPAMQVPRLWAAWRTAALADDPELHRAQVMRIGQRFGLVTAGTSLLVLDDPADYVRYDVPAPAGLREVVAGLREHALRERAQSRSERLDEVAAEFAERIAWWQRDFPKGAPPRPEKQRSASPAPAAMVAPAPPSPAAPAAQRTVGGNAATLDQVMVTGSRIDDAVLAEAAAPVPGEPEGENIAIHLQPWQPDSPYARRLRAAPPERLYAVYLDERDGHADSTAFYLDVADLLLQRGRAGEALRVLSNLAELDLGNRHVLRVLGYRLMQARAWPQAVQVFRAVLALADEEPQSHRDLGLALAAAGERQEAIGHLYEVAARPWDGRFAEVELVALNELNAVVANSPRPLDTSAIDRRLLRNMPLDLRVVLGWDSDNSDMDLWVTDPNGEKCYYGNRNTYQGGLLSDDFTGGYGPEEFVLRDARPGTYKVEAHYFGDRQQIVTGATTLTLTLSTGWAGPRQHDQTVTMRLSGQDESVLVGEFEVR